MRRMTLSWSRQVRFRAGTAILTVLLSLGVANCVWAQEKGVAPGGQADSRAAAKPPASATVTQAQKAEIKYGRDIAVAQCASCHALDDKTTSPNPDAPPLRNALWRFEEDGLATYFIEALQVGHGDMPVFDFTPIGADALIAYLKSIKTPQDIDER